MIREVMCLLLLAVGTEVASDPDIKNLQVYILKLGYKNLLECVTDTAWQSVQVNLATWTDTETLGPGYTKLIPASGGAECLAAYSMENDTITDEIECAMWSRSKGYNAFAIEDDICIIYGPKYNGAGTCDSSRPYVYVSNTPLDFNITDAPTINVTDVSGVSIGVTSVTWALDDPCNLASEVRVCHIASDGTKACVSTDNPEQTTMTIGGMVMCQYNTVYAEVSSAIGVSTSANATLDRYTDATQSVTITHASILDDSSVEVSWDFINYCNLTFNSTEVCVYGEYCNTFTTFTTEGTLTGVSFSTSCNISLEVTATVVYNTDSGTFSSSNVFNATSNIHLDPYNGFQECETLGAYGLYCVWEISDECGVLTGVEICLKPGDCVWSNITASKLLTDIYNHPTYIFRNLDYLTSYILSFRFHYNLQDGQGDRITETGHYVSLFNRQNYMIYGPEGYICDYQGDFTTVSCFRMSPEPMTYAEGDAFCQQENAFLAEITASYAEGPIESHMRANAYIALNDIESEGQFRNPIFGAHDLEDEEEFALMDKSDPNGDKDCVVMTADKYGYGREWINVKCDSKHRVLCQIDLEEAQPDQAFVCPDGDMSSDGYCYRVTDEPMTQAAGVEWCEQNFGYAYFHILFNPLSVYERSNDVPLRPYHTGYREYSEQDVFEHKMFGALYTYFNGDGGSSEVECLSLNSVFKWEIVDCDEERHMICMKKADLGPQLQTCPQDTGHFFYRFEDVCLSYNDGCPVPRVYQTNFSHALSSCESSGSSLTSLDNQRLEIVLAETTCDPSYWIGLTDEGSPNEFHWVDGTPLNYTNWGPNQPEEGKHCVIFNYVSFYWETADCTENHEYVCKMDFVPPE